MLCYVWAASSSSYLKSPQEKQRGHQNLKAYLNLNQPNINLKNLTETLNYTNVWCYVMYGLRHHHHWRNHNKKNSRCAALFRSAAYRRAYYTYRSGVYWEHNFQNNKSQRLSGNSLIFWAHSVFRMINSNRPVVLNFSKWLRYWKNALL